MARYWLAMVMGVVMTGMALGAGQPAGPRVSTSGDWTLGGIHFTLIHFNPKWEMTGQAGKVKVEGGFPKSDDGGQVLRGRWPVTSGEFLMEERIRPAGAGAFTYEVSLSSEAGVETNALALSGTLPVEVYAGEAIIVDGQRVALPSAFKEMGVLHRSGVKKIQIPTTAGQMTIEGPVNLSVQDNRAFNGDTFEVRLSLDPSSGTVKSSRLRLAVSQAAGSGLAALPGVEILANEMWKPVKHSLDIEAGSVLDFSNLLDAPAGKHGPIVVRGAHFEFAGRPGRPVRFYGTNTCFSANFPTREQAERIAERIARMGYNAVRIHHYDQSLVDARANDSTTLDAGQLDRLDYYVACLKKRGIYINIDLYTIRQTKAHEIPELNVPVREGYKAAVPLLDSAMRNWQAFARNLMTHRNPHTGLTWAEEPALVGICPLNEDPLAITYRERPALRTMYEQRFEAWLKERNLAPADDAARNSAMSRFLTELQIKANERTFAFLKGLGVKAPLTSVNCLDAVSLAPVRAREEYVDNHAYWDHPNFPERQWSLPHRYSNKSATAEMARVPRTMMATRVLGKPFTCTEINYCMPNQYRAESGPLMGAYAALQDWDGLYRFALSHNVNNLVEVSAASGFDLSTDPLSLLSERIGMLLFLRGDVRASTQTVPFLVSEETAHSGLAGWGTGAFPEQYQMLGLHGKIGSVYAEKEAPDLSTYPIVAGSARVNAGLYKEARFIPADGGLLPGLVSQSVVPAGEVDLQKRRVMSDTGEVQLMAGEGSLQVVTARTECFVLGDGTARQGKAVSAQGDGAFAVVSVSSMDGQPLGSSQRMLVIHLTDLQNTGTRYRGKSKTMLEQWGKLPHLVRAGKATVGINAGGGNVRMWALDAAGRRQEPVALNSAAGGRVTATIDTSRAMAYEVTRE